MTWTTLSRNNRLKVAPVGVGPPSESARSVPAVPWVASNRAWTIDAYTLVVASLLMLSGSTAGRRRVFQIGLALFSLASLLCALAPNLGLLVGFRMLQAVGASMLNPVAMSIRRR